MQVSSNLLGGQELLPVALLIQCHRSKVCSRNRSLLVAKNMAICNSFSLSNAYKSFHTFVNTGAHRRYANRMHKLDEVLRMTCLVRRPLNE